MISFYFTSTIVAVFSSQLSVSSSTLWSDCNPPSDFVNGPVSPLWFMVYSGLHSQTELARSVFVHFDLTRKLRTWLLDIRVGYNSLVNHKSRGPVFCPLRTSRGPVLDWWQKFLCRWTTSLEQSALSMDFGLFRQLLKTFFFVWDCDTLVTFCFWCAVYKLIYFISSL